MARVSTHRLEQLVREAEVLSTIKADVPNALKILELEIGRARAAVVRSADSTLPETSENNTTTPLEPHHHHPHHHHHHPRQSIRKRVKLRVPAEQYPDYNFVGRLLGPRGATLKRLERDTSCRIMIRGKGSIRKDKEAEVRGKPGWEHVFHDPLHVVIEVVDAPDEISAATILTRAKELVELLLVPVPEERDSLKRAQLRDLAILNGTHRSVSDLLASSVQNIPLPSSNRPSPPPPAPQPLPSSSPSSSPPPQPSVRRSHSLQHANTSQTIYAPDYSAAFDPPVPFPAHNSTQFSSSAPANQRSIPSAVTSYPLSTAFSSTPQDSIIPDLEKLCIPSLDFDHLNEPNLSTPPFAMPSASPTIVDPEIYPYPPTPGLLSVEQQLNAFGSPMWTPSRPSPSPASSNSLPPRSPPATSEQGSSNSASFLLGRALGDHSRHHHAQFTRDAPLSRDPLPFEQPFVSQVGQQFADAESRDFAQQQRPSFAGMKNASGDSIILANFFPAASSSSSLQQSSSSSAQPGEHLSTDAISHAQKQSSQPSSSSQQQQQQLHPTHHLYQKNAQTQVHAEQQQQTDLDNHDLQHTSQE